MEDFLELRDGNTALMEGCEGSTGTGQNRGALWTPTIVFYRVVIYIYISTTS
jgi:hypothetical protein